jgi:hypothetical protein
VRNGRASKVVSSSIGFRSTASSTARDRIDGFVQHELRDLRRALRQQRKRMGI